MQEIKLQKMGSLRVGEQTQILENRKRVMCSWSERFDISVGQLGLDHLLWRDIVSSIFIDNFINHEHDKLTKRSSGSRGDYTYSRFLKLKTQEKSLHRY